MRVCDIRYQSLTDFIRFAVRRNAAAVESATWLSIATVINHDVDLHTLTIIIIIIIIRYSVLITTEYRLTDRIIIWTTYDNCRLQDDHGAVPLAVRSVKSK